MRCELAALAEIALLDATAKRSAYWSTVTTAATETYSDRLAHLIRTDARPPPALTAIIEHRDDIVDVWRHYLAQEDACV